MEFCARSRIFGSNFLIEVLWPCSSYWKSGHPVRRYRNGRELPCFVVGVDRLRTRLARFGRDEPWTSDHQHVCVRSQATPSHLDQGYGS